METDLGDSVSLEPSPGRRAGSLVEGAWDGRQAWGGLQLPGLVSTPPQTHPVGATSFLINEGDSSSQHSLGRD